MPARACALSISSRTDATPAASPDVAAWEAGMASTDSFSVVMNFFVAWSAWKNS